MEPEIIITIFGGMAVGLMVLITILKQFLFVGRPNEVLVFSGRNRTLSDGRTIGYRELIGGGRALRIPVLEKVDRMQLVTLPIDIRISNAYTQGGIPLDVHAVANVKISSDPKLIGNAIERFMGRDPIEIQQVAKETLEGHLRGVLATLTPEEVNEDRLKFANALVEEAEEDFLKLGLHLDTLKIQNVADPVNYLESIGRKRISEVIRDAEIAESTAIAEAKEQEAIAKREAEVAMQVAQTEIIRSENELRTLQAEQEAKIQSAIEEATAASLQARAEAEAELQEIRGALEQLRLMADKVLPAEANQQAESLRAKGKAAHIEESGIASAEVLEMMTQAWLIAGDDAKDIFLIQQLEDILKTVVDRVTGAEVKEVVLLDSGRGDALPRYVASYPAAVRQVLEELKISTGIDVTGILSGKKDAAF